MAKTGIQGFWNYDVFSLLGPMSARPQTEALGFVNMWNLNLCFTQTDIVMKFHNNPPFITRSYNSKVASTDVNFRSGISLVGKDWMLNYEHCIIEECDPLDEEEHYPILRVHEIDPTRCVNDWAYVASPESWTAPAGVFKDMSKPDDNTYEITTRDHFVYHFTKKTIPINNVTGDNNFIYGLDYIEDRNGTRVYVDWETVPSEYDRIRAIQVSLDSGTTKYDVIEFSYDDEDEPYLISSYRLVPIPGTEPSPWVYDMKWQFSYDANSHLEEVTYPAGSAGDGKYTFVYDSDEFTVNDMEGTKHYLKWITVLYEQLQREVWVKGGGSYYSRVLYRQFAGDITTVGDPETPANIWTFDHDNTGKLITVTDPITSSPGIWTYYWTAHYQIDRLDSPSGDGLVLSYDSTTKNLLTVGFGTMGGTFDSHTTNYTYGTGDNIYDVVKVELHEDYDSSGYYFTETQFEYDTNHNLILIRAGINPQPIGAGKDPTDPEQVDINAVTSIEYDSHGNVTKIIMPEGNITELVYNTNLSEAEFGGLHQIKSHLAAEADPPTIELEWDYFEFRLIGINYGDSTPDNHFSYTNIGEQWLSGVEGGGVYQSFYDLMGNPIRMESPDSVTTIDYNLGVTPLNLPYRIVSPSPNEDERSVTITYFKNGLTHLRTSKYNGDSYDVEYGYDQARRLILVKRDVDTVGTTYDTSYSYDSNGALVSLIGPGGSPTEKKYTYNFAGQVTALFCAGDDGNTPPPRWERVLYTYEGPMGLVNQITYKSGPNSSDEAVHKLFYDRLGRIVRWEMPDVTYNPTFSFSIKYYYDRNSNMIFVNEVKKEVDGETTTYSYRRGYFEYDGLNRLVKAHKEYNGEDVLDVAYQFDQRGRVVETSYGGIVNSRMQYDSFGNVSAIYGVGQEPSDGKQFEYDTRTGRLQKIIYRNGNARTVTYNQDGSVSSFTDEAGRTFKREYYENGWLKRIIYPSGDFIGYVYDGLGRIIKVYESVPDLNTSGSAPPFGSTQDTALTLEVDYHWNSGEMEITYKTFRSLSAPIYYETKYTLDVRGRLKTVTYDVVSCPSPGPHSYNFTYDGKGNPTVIGFDGNALVTNTFNNLNQLTSQAFDSGVNSFKYCCCRMNSAWESTSPTPIGFHRKIDFTYDKLHRLTAATSTDHITTNLTPDYVELDKTFEYKWDNSSNLVQIKDPYYIDNEDNPLFSSYKQSEDRTTATVQRIDTTNPLPGNAESYAHLFDEFGRIKRIDIPDLTSSGTRGPNETSIRLEYSYYDTGDLRTLTASSVATGDEIYYIEYVYNADGRMIERIIKNSSTDSGWGNWAKWEYDGRNQLIGEKYTYSLNGSSITTLYSARIAYDLAGNVTTKIITNPNSPVYLRLDNFSYGKSYQLLSFVVSDYPVGGSGSTWTYTVVYDNRGNITDITVTGTPPAPFAFPGSMTYNAFNRLISYNGSQYIWYDPLGNVFRKADSTGVDPTEATHYYYSVMGLAQEYDMTISSGSPVDALVYDYLAGLNGRVLRRRKIPGTTNNEVSLVQDKQGSTINLAEADNDRMSTGPGYTFDAWGQSFQPGTGSQPAQANHIRYHGGFVESFESANDKDGVYRMGARHYSTVIGRFFQRDPLLLNVVPNAVYPLALNPYIYSLNRPTTLTDTSGWAPGGSCCGGGAPPNPGFKPEPAKPPFPIEPGGGVGGPSIPIPCGISPYVIMYFMGDMSGGDSGPQLWNPGFYDIACVRHYPNPEKCCPGWDPLTDPEHCCCIAGYYANTEKHWPKKIVPLVQSCCGYESWETTGDPEHDRVMECNRWCCEQVYGASASDGGSKVGAAPGTYCGRGGCGLNPYIPTLPMVPPKLPVFPGNQPGGLDPGLNVPGFLHGQFGSRMMGWGWVGGGIAVSGFASTILIFALCTAFPGCECCNCRFLNWPPWLSIGSGLLQILIGIGVALGTNPAGWAIIGAVLSLLSWAAAVGLVVCFISNCEDNWQTLGNNLGLH